MRILICAATRTEAQACRVAEKAAWLDPAGVSALEVLETGVGSMRAARTLLLRLAQKENVDLVISSGFAGALSRGIPVGSWIISQEIFEESAPGEVERILSLPPDHQDEELLRARATRTSAIPARLVSVARITRDAAMRLAPLGPALAVDMEAAALARVCRDYDVPFVALRYVTDAPSRPLPGFLSSFSDAANTQDAWARASLALRGSIQALSTPTSVLGLVRDGFKWSEELKRGWA